MRDALIEAINLADAGQWDAAHQIVQKLDDRLAYWIHANLHREEGDIGNAQYWYARAQHPYVTIGFSQERDQILTEIGD